MPEVADRPRRAAEKVPDARAGISPAVQMRMSLERQRSMGRAFDVAWEQAFGKIRWPHATPARQFWKATLSTQRHLWRAAYEGRDQLPSVEATRRLA